MTEEQNVHVFAHLRSEQLLLKENQRRESIENEVAKYRNAGTKRAVRLTRRVLFQLDDIDEILKIDDERETFATAENFEDVNVAIACRLLQQNHRWAGKL